MVAAKGLIGGLVGAVGLVQTPGDEAGTPGVDTAAVAEAQVAQIIAELHIVGAAGDFAGERAVFHALLIAKLGQGDGKQVRPVVTGDRNALVILIVDTVFVRGGGAGLGAAAVIRRHGLQGQSGKEHQHGQDQREGA